MATEAAQAKSDFYFASSKEIIMAQNFTNVRVYLYFKEKKWSDTNMVGNLRLVKVGDTGLPIVVVRLNPVDLLGKEQDPILEYELPVNFKPLQVLTDTFAALQSNMGVVLGFSFKTSNDCRKWSNEIDRVRKMLSVGAEDLKTIKAGANGAIGCAFGDQIESNI